MTTLVAAGRRHLPRGWADLGLQLAIWFGFLALYQVARGFADRNPTQAFENGLGVIRIEEHVGDLFELTAANLVSGSHFLVLLVNWTYWNSEFTVVGLALLWVYLRRNESFVRFRNWILAANAIGLVGYVLLPTAPPRMLTRAGSSESSRMAAMATAAKASLISKRSMSPTESPVFFRSFWMAPTGAVVNHSGACATPA